MTPASGSVTSEKVPVVRIVPMGEEDPVAVSKKDRFLLSTIVVLLIILAALAVLLASLVFIMSVLYGYFSRIQQKQLKIETQLAAQGVPYLRANAVRRNQNAMRMFKSCGFAWVRTDCYLLGRDM